MSSTVWQPRGVTDRRLAEQVREGSELAFETLYTRHRRGVLALCMRLLGSLEEAEDACQQTLVAAYCHVRRAGPPEAVRPWLYTVAHNHCVSVLRARREHPSDVLPERAGADAASEFAAREEIRVVLADVAGLQGRHRTALVLAAFDDRSQ